MSANTLGRPDGSHVTGIGSGLIIVGIIAIFFVGSAETAVGFQVALLIAYLGIGLGVLLCALGYLVRAIWFLPGREIELDPGKTEWEAGVSECAYCRLEITAPAEPCSAVSPDELAGMTDRIDDERCFRVLHEQGILAGNERVDRKI
ncbi:hypothetical protein [Aurantiacibacter aquimixticola]|uniref:Uncharacterized protein n=1 Tax=Aurantiacibacter aquimixticola TaxID=1958945 RepID=A0A419RUB2_9SPHN|nr:hypothetical protein [Aurantiacibacter aquimixticola]RJY09383.1 hypothetical protein D6201_08470 [Aurantiacibacter aquimixticola]